MDAVNGNVLRNGRKLFKPEEFNVRTYFPTTAELGREPPESPAKPNDSSSDVNLGTYFPAKMELDRELPKMSTNLVEYSDDFRVGSHFPAKVELDRELPKLPTNPDNSSGIFDVGKDLPELPTKLTDSLVPLTPDSVRENGYGNASPVDFSPSSHQDDKPVASKGYSLGTPKDSVFDPFASSPDHLVLAPRSQKYSKDSGTSAVRRLKFEESPTRVRLRDHNNHKEAICDEEMLFEMVYNNLLEVIVSKQKEEFLAGIADHISYSSGDRTPTSTPLLAGISETCPAAPKKPTAKFRNVDKSLCRKLEF